MLRTACLAFVLLCATTSTAAAQAPPGSDFAGGAASGPGSIPDGSSEIGIKVDGSGSRATVRAVGVRACSRGRSTEGESAGTVTVAPDGTFSGALNRRRQARAVGFSIRVTVAGRIEAGRATGTLRVVTRRRGKPYCSGDVAFDARPAAALSGEPAPVPAGAVLVGRTSGRSGGPFGFNLRVSADGKRIERVVTTWREGCRSVRGTEETNYSPTIAIRPDGTFTKTERFTVRFSDATQRVTVVTTGRFVAGGATGTVRARSTARSRKTKRVIDRCNTGALTWSATP
ncbi:MAG: hypothetical protein AVDCRST_MAG85-3167 [uncultured Solirubrobacteraceae bacterium]|uniref:Uncharacterized protein n=1 Tax=uncultured Solirubrobacteraceae bacterium TaxID=1162706 RepID=A0A6J4TL25_9ACTN|nr:MAG: hypothetical protein AVDCRST_MAG85-3167 [uncultured Solirubrobacteraceae bacterium]